MACSTIFPFNIEQLLVSSAHERITYATLCTHKVPGCLYKSHTWDPLQFPTALAISFVSHQSCAQ